MNLGKYREAVDDCRASLQYKLDYPKVIKRLVSALIALGELDEAKLALEQAVTVNESNKMELIDEIKLLKTLEEAKDSMQKAIQRKNYESALYFANDLIKQCPASPKLKVDLLE